MVSLENANAQTILNGFFSPKGEATVALSYTYKPYSEFYAGKELQHEAPAGFGEVTSHIGGLYGQYAITDWLEGVVNLPYISQSNKNDIPDPVNNDDTVSDIQDLGIYLKAKAFQVNKGKSTFTGAVGAGVSTPLSDYDAGGILSIGNRSTNVDGYAIAQYRHSSGFLMESQYGYSIRNGIDNFDVPDAHLMNFKLGFAHKYFYADAQLGIQSSIGGTDIGSEEFAQQGGPTSFPNNDVDYTNLGLSVYYPIQKTNWGLSFAYNTILDGRNVGKYSAYTSGIVYKVK